MPHVLIETRPWQYSEAEGGGADRRRPRSPAKGFPDPARGSPRQIVESLEPLGIPSDHVSIAVRDLPASELGDPGGIAASDVDLGFDVNV